jgi:polar amino acid transport system permease protein
MVGQYFLEKRFARGVGDRRPSRKDGGGGLTGTASGVSGTERPTVVQPMRSDNASNTHGGGGGA